MKLLEKAYILYNHLFFNNLPHDYFLNIKSNNNYFKIVRHKNYNPRIVEHVTKTGFYNRMEPSNFIGCIIEKLDNPEDVWRDEFRNRMDEIDRVLVNTLYSLTDNAVRYDELEIAFNKRIHLQSGIDTSNNSFKNSMIRLTNSVLKPIEDRGTIKVSVITPSINDYILSEISANTSEQVSIILSAQFIKQMMKMTKALEATTVITEKIFSGDFLKAKTLRNSVFFYFLQLLTE